MSVRLGIVKGTSVAKPRNARQGKARLLQVEVGQSLVTMQLVAQAGEDYNPPNGTLVAFIETGGRGFVIGAFDKVDPSVGQGERKLYATDGQGTVKASIHLKADGSVVVDGGQITIQAAASLTLKTGDGALWKPNILPNDPMTGVPHGGPTAGITKLKGA